MAQSSALLFGACRGGVSASTALFSCQSGQIPGDIVYGARKRRSDEPLGVSAHLESVQVSRLAETPVGARPCSKLSGLVNILGDAHTGEVIDAYIVGTKATEVIQELVGLRDLLGGYAELARIPHGHPTMSEAMVEATRVRQRMARSWLADLEWLPLSGRSLAGLDHKRFDVINRRTKRGFKSARVSMRLRE